VCARGVAKILFVISDGGRGIHEVVSQFTPPGASAPVSNQTSADDWKVASDKDYLDRRGEHHVVAFF